MNTKNKRLFLAAACAALFAVPGAAQAALGHAILDPENPRDLLQCANDAAERMAGQLGDGKITAREARQFAAKVDQFKAWYEASTRDMLWTPGSLHALKIPVGRIDRAGRVDGDAEQFGLGENVDVYPCGARNLGWPAGKPLPTDGVVFALGTYSNGVLLVTKDFGYFQSIPQMEYDTLCGNANVSGGAGMELVDRRQWDKMLVAIYREKNLPQPENGLVQILPYALAGLLALIVFVLLLAILFRRKGSHGAPAPRALCPTCGAPLMPDGRCPAGCGESPAPAPAPEPAPAPAPSAPHEHCPTCGSELVDGVCPNGCTLVRCPTCDSIMDKGVCPVCGKQEICPTCGSELVDGVCPTGCTLVRCPTCDRILVNGVCPNGCNAAPLSLGWPGTTKPTLTPYKLEVIAPAKYASSRCDLPFEAVAGRSASEKKTTEVYIQLRFDDKRKAQACSRRYVKFVCDPATNAVSVELLSTSGRAVVAGKVLSSAGEKAEFPVNEILDLPNAEYKLRLVRA